jgi:Spy/CpxP family protein refolding chaperone
MTQTTRNKMIAWMVVLTIFVAGCAGPILSAPAGTVAAGAPVTPTPSAYAELLDGEIRGIDPDTVAGYLAGEGLGLALPAELNGYPGPRHVLELRAELDLTSEQKEQVQALFDAMQPQAVELGEAILAAEAALENDFRNRTIEEESLKSQLQQIGALQAQLRFVHLRTHLETVEILSPHQVRQYNSLRGYEQMPAGHDHQDHQ